MPPNPCKTFGPWATWSDIYSQLGHLWVILPTLSPVKTCQLICFMLQSLLYRSLRGSLGHELCGLISLLKMSQFHPAAFIEPANSVLPPNISVSFCIFGIHLCHPQIHAQLYHLQGSWKRCYKVEAWAKCGQNDPKNIGSGLTQPCVQNPPASKPADKHFIGLYGTENDVHHVNFLMIGWHLMSLALGLGEEQVTRTRNR